MKSTKYILGVLLMFAGLGGLLKGSVLSGILLIVLGISLLPPTTEFLISRFKFLQNKSVRNSIYILLFLVSVAAMNKTKPINSKAKSIIESTKVAKVSDTSKSIEVHRFKTCSYSDEESSIIPEMNAADVYLNFENKGFKIDKQIKSDHTSIYCELSSPETKFTVIVTGCSPDEIVSVEANAIDYSGSNQGEVQSFLEFVSTLQYKDAKPDEAKKWISENINVNGASINIGGVAFTVNFKTEHSRILRIEVKVK
jgi:hypothetical protein